MIQTVVPTAARAATAATIARIVSNALTVAAGATAGRDPTEAGGRCATGAAEPVRGSDGAGGAACEGGAAAAGAGAIPAAPVGPPGGSVGSLIVGAAEGLGGKLMRTVSFFG